VSQSFVQASTQSAVLISSATMDKNYIEDFVVSEENKQYIVKGLEIEVQ
jgi:hypothetical protein